MLTRTPKTLERDGMVDLPVHPSTLPQLEYTLPALGHSVSETVRQLAEWAAAHQREIAGNRLQYDQRQI
ncbi:HxlR-like helix-turn-helix [compost metagenome]